MLIPAPRPPLDDQLPHVVLALPDADQDPRPQVTEGRFPTMQHCGTNVAADVIIGFVVVGIGTLPLAGRRGFHGLRWA